MAEDTPATSTPVADAGEAAAERAPSAQPKADDAAPDAPQEKETEKANESEQKESEQTKSSEEKKESTEATTEEPSAPAEGSDAKKPEESAAAPADSEAAPAPDANGTPASAKKGGSAKRKSTGGDNKSKLNRKKSQIRVTQLHAKPGEYYLARLRSFPPWPSIICDEEILPQTLLDTRPVTAMRSDGTYRDDYADGGKRAHERTFPVMFFQTNEFAWIPNTDLSPTDPATCKEVSEKGKSKLLLNAYNVASEGHDLQHFKDLLADHQRAIQQEEEEADAKEAAKAAAKAEKDAKKNKRKSMEIIDDADDMDMDDAEETKKPKSSKKRKKDTETDGEADKPAKTPKTATKLKLTTPKTPASETKKAPASKSKAAGGKKNAKAAAKDESEDNGAASKEPEKQLDPAEVKQKKEKEILYIRHKLQKGFISRDQPPKEEEMTTMSGYFTKLENHADLEVSIIRVTKINKVLKMIVKLDSIPRDEEFNFRRRAVDILSKWKNVLDPAEEKDEAKPKANGVHKEDSVDTPVKAEAEEEKEKESETKENKEAESAEPQDEAMPDADSTEKAQAPEPAKDQPEKESDASKEAPKEGEKTSEDKSATEEKTAEAAA